MFEDRILSVVSRKLGVPTDSLSMDTSAKDFVIWDSLFHLSLISEIEEELSIKLSLDILFTVDNIGQLINACEDSCDASEAK